MFRKTVVAVVFFLVASVTALAADFNGKWTATVETQMGTQTMTFNFHVDGAKLTGTVTTQRGETEISDGKIDGDSISFVQAVNFGGNDLKIVYTGKADAAGAIKFKRQVGDRPAVEFSATRPK